MSSFTEADGSVLGKKKDESLQYCIVLTVKLLLTVTK